MIPAGLSVTFSSECVKITKVKAPYGVAYKAHIAKEHAVTKVNSERFRIKCGHSIQMRIWSRTKSSTVKRSMWKVVTKEHVFTLLWTQIVTPREKQSTLKGWSTVILVSRGSACIDEFLVYHKLEKVSWLTLSSPQLMWETVSLTQDKPTSNILIERSAEKSDGRGTTARTTMNITYEMGCVVLKYLKSSSNSIVISDLMFYPAASHTFQ